MNQSPYKIFPPLPQRGKVSLNGWWALWAQKRRRKRAAANAGADPGFVPDDMQLWLQASSVTDGLGNSVALWQDQSGNVNDASEPAVSMQPTLQEVTFAGKTFPVLRFDTVDDGMETPLVIDGAFSIFALWRPSILSGRDCLVGVAGLEYGDLLRGNALLLHDLDGWRNGQHG